MSVLPSILEIYLYAYRNSEDTQRCVDSIRNTGDQELRITVFDNSPEPSSFSSIDSYYHFPFDPSRPRLANWAIGMCRTPWIFLGGSDVLFKQGWKDRIMDEAHRESADIHHYFYAYFFRRSLVRTVGWFDETWNAGLYDDTDYVRRLVLKEKRWCTNGCGMDQLIPNGLVVPSSDRVKFGSDTVQGTRVYFEKWGDNNSDPRAGGTPKWEVPDYYPRALV